MYGKNEFVKVVEFVIGRAGLAILAGGDGTGGG